VQSIKKKEQQENNPFLKELIGCKVRIITSMLGKDYFYRGLLLDISDEFINLDDIKLGETLIRLRDIRSINKLQRNSYGWNK